LRRVGKERAWEDSATKAQRNEVSKERGKLGQTAFFGWGVVWPK